MEAETCPAAKSAAKSSSLTGPSTKSGWWQCFFPTYICRNSYIWKPDFRKLLHMEISKISICRSFQKSYICRVWENIGFSGWFLPPNQYYIIKNWRKITLQELWFPKNFRCAALNDINNSVVHLPGVGAKSQFLSVGYDVSSVPTQYCIPIWPEKNLGN